MSGLQHNAHISHLWWSGLTQAEPLALGQYQAFTSVICFLSLWYTVLESLSPKINFKLSLEINRSLRKSSKFLQALSTVSWCAHHVLSWDNIRLFVGYHSVNYLVATWTCCLRKTVCINYPDRPSLKFDITHFWARWRIKDRARIWMERFLQIYYACSTSVCKGKAVMPTGARLWQLPGYMQNF